jgi:hypothetical protein
MQIRPVSMSASLLLLFISFYYSLHSLFPFYLSVFLSLLPFIASFLLAVFQFCCGTLIVALHSNMSDILEHLSPNEDHVRRKELQCS